MSFASKSTSVVKRDAFLYASKFVVNIFIARELGAEALGLFYILMLIPSYAESFGRVKFDAAAVYYLGKRRYGLDEVLYHINLMAVLSALAMLALFFWWREPLIALLFDTGHADVRGLATLIAFQVPLQFLWMNYSYMLLHVDDIRRYNAMVVINALTASLAGLASLWFLGWGLWGVVGSVLLGTACSLAYAVRALGTVGRPGAALLDTALVRDLFSYGAKLYGGGIVSHLQIQLTTLLAAVFLTPTQVAFYGTARSFGQIVDRLPQAVNIILYPRLSKLDDRAEAALLAARAARLIVLVLCAVGLIATPLMHPMLRLVYGEAFGAAALPFALLMPGIVAAGGAYPLLTFFLSIDRADLGIWALLPPLALQGSVALALIPSLGPEGAALAFSAGMAVYGALLAWLFVRLSPCSASDLAPRRADVAFLRALLAREGARMAAPLLRRLGR